MGNLFSHSESPELLKYETGSYKSKKNPRPGYYVNKGVVYYRGNVIKKADAETFQKLRHGWAKDKNYVYKQGKISEDYKNPSKFKLVGDIPSEN